MARTSVLATSTCLSSWNSGTPTPIQDLPHTSALPSYGVAKKAGARLSGTNGEGPANGLRLLENSDFFDQADDIVVQIIEFLCRDPVFENGAASHLVDLVIIEEGLPYIEAGDVADP